MLGCGSALASLGLTRYNRESRLRGGYPTVTAFVTLVEFGAVARDTARARSSSSSLPHLTSLAVRFFRSICGGAFRAALVDRQPCRDA